MADIGWLTVVEATTYFSTRLNSDLWTAATAGEKTAALTTSYNRIRYLKDYSIPSSPTVAQEAVLADAECELAYYMLIHLEDEDRRKGLQAQGVAGAGVVKEVYSRFGSDAVAPTDIPLPPIVLQMLDSFAAYKNTPFYSVDIDRDEDEAVSEDVTEF